MYSSITGLVSTSRAIRSTSVRAASAEAVGERELEILALTHGDHFSKPDLAQSIVDGLALWVQDRCLQRDIDMRLHYP